MSFLSDTFTDAYGTLLTAHSPATGGAWSINSGDTSAQVGTGPGASGHVMQGWGTGTFARNAAAPAGTDYTVSAPITHGGSYYYGLQGGVIARCQTSSTTGYVLVWDIPSQNWKLYRVVSGSWVQLATTGSYPVSFETWATASLAVAGSGATVTLTAKNGSDTLFGGAVTDSDASRIVAAGYAGIYLSTNAGGYGVFIDSITADDAASNSGGIAATEAVDTAAVSGSTQTRTATITLVDRTAATQNSLSSLKWAFYQTMPWVGATPTDYGTTETTDGSGILAVTLPNCTLTNGQVGYLIVTDSDGTTGQSPSAKVFAGPVAVAVS